MTDTFSPGDVRNPSPELATLYDRIAKGVAWLTEHDPAGAFHFWFESKISPYGPMPAQGDDQREAYRTYHRQRKLFEDLWAKMVRLERRELEKEVSHGEA